MNKTLKTSVIAVAAILGATSASALTATFNLKCGTYLGVTTPCDDSTPNSTQFANMDSAFVQTVNGLTGTFDAKYVDGAVSFLSNTVVNNPDVQDAKVGHYSTGAGIHNRRWDDHFVDGDNNFNDFFWMHFSEEVTVTSMVFGNYGGNDRHYWMYDKSGDGVFGNGDYFSNQVDADASNPANTWTDFLDDGSTVVNDYWGVAAFASSSEWKLHSVTVEWEAPDPGPTPDPIPLPAAGWMLLAGLGGMTAMKRRKKKAS